MKIIEERNIKRKFNVLYKEENYMENKVLKIIMHSAFIRAEY